MNILVDHLSFETNEEMLREHFLPYGKVASVKIITDPESGHAIGIGIVKMPHFMEAIQAINALNRSCLNGRVISLREVGRARLSYEPGYRERNPRLPMQVGSSSSG